MGLPSSDVIAFLTSFTLIAIFIQSIIKNYFGQFEVSSLDLAYITKSRKPSFEIIKAQNKILLVLIPSRSLRK